MFHEFFSTLPQSLKILDYGTGPAIMTVISAAPHSSKIILSDYSPENRESLTLWLEKSDNAFNWSPLFDHVVQKLEGKSEEEARKREELVRKVVTAVIHCDIYSDPIVEKGFEGTYDVVSSSCCLNSSCSTRRDFKNNLQKLAKLVKPGGILILFQSQRNMDTDKEHGYFYTGKTRHPVVNVSAQFVGDIVRNLDYKDIRISSAFDGDNPAFLDNDSRGFFFLTAVRQE